MRMPRRRRRRGPRGRRPARGRSDRPPVTVMSAPISRSTSTMAMRLGLRPTARTRSSASGWSAAAASQKAADEMSPGTSTSRAANPTGPSTVVVKPSRAIGAPSQREQPLGVVAGGPGRRDGRRPSAASAASVTAPSTCALGDRQVVMQRPQWPRTPDGHGRVPVDRRDRDAHLAQRHRDPLHGSDGQGRVADQRAAAGRPARAPIDRRMLVPELPQSSVSPPAPGRRATAGVPPPRIR